MIIKVYMRIIGDCPMRAISFFKRKKLSVDLPITVGDNKNVYYINIFTAESLIVNIIDAIFVYVSVACGLVVGCPETPKNIMKH